MTAVASTTAPTAQKEAESLLSKAQANLGLQMARHELQRQLDKIKRDSVYQLVCISQSFSQRKAIS